jgi:uncharacterized protein (TIGR01777 family)
MKIILAGATGQVGRVLLRGFARENAHDLVILTRAPSASSPEVRLPGVRVVAWDARSLGPWAAEFDGADVVINLAGRSVNCRYTRANLDAMLSSRVGSTRVIGEAIARAARPPRVWLQMSTATIYAHRFDAPNDEATGIIGGSEPDVPRYWDKSIEIARAWESTLDAAPTPHTRKIALRTAMVMSPDRGGVFDTLAKLARRGFGGAHGSGAQFVSWIHEYDFAAAVRFLLSREDLSGPVNLASPGPLTNRLFQTVLRHALLIQFSLSSPAWLLKLGAFVLGTDTELLLKSRRVIPGRLLASGFTFRYPDWPSAAIELARRWARLEKK